jgi:hypothetical protein
VLRVRTALTRLPWVDQADMQANVTTKQVKLSVTDAKQYNEEQLKDALQQQHFDGVKVLAQSVKAQP